jgi:riboflavin kinase / FMN adenylyltransferase
MTNELPASLQGTTKHYKGNGRKLGYPTANIDVPTDLPDGVYFGFASLGAFKKLPALIFIGTPVTVGDTERRVEAHVPGIPDIDYYDQQLVLAIQHFHRANQKFDSIEALLVVMKDDETALREWLSHK